LKKEKRVILIVGTPCVGKTSVSRRLSAKINALHVDLARLVKDEGLFIGVDEERDTLIADINGLSKRIEEIIRTSNRDVIVDGHYAMHVVSPTLVNRVFVLRRAPEELKEAMEARGYSGQKLWENLAAEILDVCLSDAISICGLEKTCEIDVTDKAVEEVVNEIVEVLDRKRKCPVGIVDWLGKLEEEGRLDDYLKN
jgi:adenylate kinase